MGKVYTKQCSHGITQKTLLYAYFDDLRDKMISFFGCKIKKQSDNSIETQPL